MTNSEFEDLLDEAVYSIAVRTAFGVVLAPKCMNTNKKQWSDRIRDCFQDQGKAWTRALERQVKDLVSNTAATAGLASLNQHRRGPIDALVATLEQRLA
jgi:hypothetical protein